MKNKFFIESIDVQGGKVIYTYNIEGDWEKYFNQKRNCEIEYGIDVSKVSESVLAIPLLGNILPIAWLCNAQIYVDTLDADFYNNLENIKNGYEKMYPMLKFAGIVNTKVAHNQPKSNNSESNTGCFFSGGVDAYTTLFRHLDEKPCLITIWGADIKLSDVPGWKNVNTYINDIAQELHLDYVTIKSDFRLLIKAGQLNKLVRKSGDGWWHGFQSGIALLSHAAPIAFISGMKKVYIASSYPETMKGQYTCASDPSIDNFVRFCGCRIWHDGYELTRQEKIQYLLEQTDKTKHSIRLRVCWEIPGGGNCCRCEKCYRTILEIIAEGKDPNSFGFVWNDQNIKHCHKALQWKIVMPQFNWDQFYPVIQDRMKYNKNHIVDMEKYNWLLRIDFANINNGIIKKVYNSALARGIKRGCNIMKSRKGKSWR